jgi:anti-sigma factor RsiW
MNEELQLKLQAHLDGELPPDAAAAMARRLETDAEARALAVELKNTRGALAGHEAGVKLPESRDFFWSKIQREIARQETAQERATAPARKASWLTWAWRTLIPVGALALVVCLVYLRPASPAEDAGFTPELEVAADDMGAYTFRDQQTGLTTVWLYEKSNPTMAAETQSSLMASAGQ